MQLTTKAKLYTEGREEVCENIKGHIAEIIKKIKIIKANTPITQ